MWKAPDFADFGLGREWIRSFASIEAVSRAEDVACEPCPLCHATPLDFHHLPWWREDLTKFADDADGYETNYAWRIRPIS